MYHLMIILHVLGASIWTGGHLILVFGFLIPAFRSRDINPLTEYENQYEKIGIPAFLVQILTGLWLAYFYQPQISSWFLFNSPVTTLISIKLILIFLTLGLALHARLKLIPNLKKENLNYLAFHIISVTTVSILLLLLGVNFRFI